MVLLDFPPLACFLNNILVAFNDLRLCCPVALAQDVTRVLEDALAKVTKVILAFTGQKRLLSAPGAGALCPVLHCLPGRPCSLFKSLSPSPSSTSSNSTDLRRSTRSALQVRKPWTREPRRSPGASGLPPAEERAGPLSGGQGAGAGAPAESGLGPEATAAGCGHPDGAQEPAGSAEAPDGDTSPAPQPRGVRGEVRRDSRGTGQPRGG